VDQLMQALHAAADNPPPTSIDLDQLIAGERRRVRWQYRAGAAGGAAVLVAGGLLAPTMLADRPGTAGGPARGDQPGCAPHSPGSDTPWPTLVPDPLVPEASRQPAPSGGDPFPRVDCTGSTGGCPTLPRTANPLPAPPGDRPGRASEDCAEAVVRLSATLAVAMGDALPGWGVMASVDPGNPNVQWVFLRQADDASPDGYVASLNLAKGSEISFLNVIVSASTGSNPNAGCAGRHLESRATCQEMPGGDVLVTQPEPVESMGGGAEWYRVTDYRTDGTTVEVRGGKPLTRDQLAAVARSGGLTLFP
jgi:hypothetical protein